jgi:H3 lysine-79-specific histone-lysine N-methyltransferase
MFGGAKSSIKPVSQQTRTERIAAARPKPPGPLPSRLSSQSKPVRKAQESTRSSPASAQSIRSPATPDRLDVPSKRKAQRQKSPGEQKPNFGEESEDEDDARSRSSAGSNKRQKVERVSPTIDTKRKLRSKRAFSQDDHDRAFPMIHAADVASPVRKSKAPDLQTGKVTVELKYPSASQRERCVWLQGLNIGRLT